MYHTLPEKRRLSNEEGRKTAELLAKSKCQNRAIQLYAKETFNKNITLKDVKNLKAKATKLQNQHELTEVFEFIEKQQNGIYRKLPRCLNAM